MINIKRITPTTFEITVQDTQTTTHLVTLSEIYHHQLTAGKTSPENLIQSAFEFLLKKEPNTSILPEFPLQKINQYFPEFESSMKKLFR